MKSKITELQKVTKKIQNLTFHRIMKLKNKI